MDGPLFCTCTRKQFNFVERFSEFINFRCATDYRHPKRKQPSLHGRKFTPTPNFLGTAEAYFVCHIGQTFDLCLHWVSVVGEMCQNQQPLFISQNIQLSIALSIRLYVILQPCIMRFLSDLSYSTFKVNFLILILQSTIDYC